MGSVARVASRVGERSGRRSRDDPGAPGREGVDVGKRGTWLVLGRKERAVATCDAIAFNGAIRRWV